MNGVNRLISDANSIAGLDNMWTTDQQMALRRLAACVSLLLSLATSSAQFSVPINSLGLAGGSIESSSGNPHVTQNASSGLIQAQTPYGASTALYEANAGAYAAKAAAVNTSLVTNDFQHPTNITATLPRSVPNITLPPDSAIESGVGDPYDYGGVLGLSLLFYEAQRSGPAAGNRVPWRADAQMNEVSSAGTTLVGGYADAGDNLKLNFPAAFAASMLAWGLSEFPQGYANAGETDNALSALRWFGDFFVRSHHADRAFTAQCGDPGADHSTWIPIEQSATPRPCYDVKLGASGADVLGAVSAALAAISQVFAHNDTAYSNILLAHAQDLYAFAKLDPTAKYSDSIPQAYVYPSSSTYDDLAWAACWLYIRTGQATFLQEAVEHYQKLPGIATYVLMGRLWCRGGSAAVHSEAGRRCTEGAAVPGVLDHRDRRCAVHTQRSGLGLPVGRTEVHSQCGPDSRDILTALPGEHAVPWLRVLGQEADQADARGCRGFLRDRVRRHPPHPASPPHRQLPGPHRALRFLVLQHPGPQPQRDRRRPRRGAQPGRLPGGHEEQLRQPGGRTRLQRCLHKRAGLPGGRRHSKRQQHRGLHHAAPFMNGVRVAGSQMPLLLSKHCRLVNRRCHLLLACCFMCQNGLRPQRPRS